MKTRATILVLMGALAAVPLAAQQGGINLRLAQAQPAKFTPALCPIKPMNSKVENGISSLRKAHDAKTPADKGAALTTARQSLVTAITQEAQTGNAAAWYYLGRVALMRGDPVETDSAFTKAQALVPSCEIDITQYRQNNWAMLANAAIEFQRGRTVKPGMTEGEAREVLGRANEVTTSTTTTGSYVLWRYGTDTFVHFLNGKVEIVTESSSRDSKARSPIRAEPDSALALFRDASILFRGLPHVYSNMGVVFANSNREDSAAVYFAKALEIAEKDTSLVDDRNAAAMNVAIMYQRLNRTPEAIAALKKFLAWKPNDTDAQKSLAIAFRSAGQVDSADAIEKAMVAQFSKTNLDSLDMGDVMAVGVTAFNSQHYPEAETAFTSATRRNPYSRDARYNLINTHFAMARAAHLKADSLRKAKFTDSAATIEAKAAKRDTSMIAESVKMLAMEPMNEDVLRLLAQAQRALKQDDALLKTAERLVALPLTIDVTGFQMGQDGAKLTLEAGGRNPQDPTGRPLPMTPVSLVLEFLDVTGAVIDSKDTEIPVLTIRIGTLADSVRATLGDPEKVNTLTTAGGSESQWVYGPSVYVYLGRNNRVTGIQTSSDKITRGDTYSTRKTITIQAKGAGIVGWRYRQKS